MKKLIIVAIVAITSVMGLRAAEGDMALGLQFNYASKNSMIGLGVVYQVEPVRNFRIAPEFIYYFENNNLSDYNVNINFHYLIPTSSNVNIYPLAGFSYVNFKDSYGGVSTHTNRYGANVGIGFEYMINNKFKFYTEERFHIIKHWNESVTSLGLKYFF